jgi:hypothetical protein
MFELTYKSVATAEISKAEIFAIMDIALKTNEVHGITGCLFFSIITLFKFCKAMDKHSIYL